MSRVMRKPVFRASDQVRLKPGCASTEDGYRGLKFRIWEVDVEVAKTKTLISCTVTAQLICAFVFAYANG